jgi:hypothetical protein
MFALAARKDDGSTTAKDEIVRKIKAPAITAPSIWRMLMRRSVVSPFSPSFQKVGILVITDSTATV